MKNGEKHHNGGIIQSSSGSYINVEQLIKCSESLGLSNGENS
jgi:hypothetical protein